MHILSFTTFHSSNGKSPLALFVSLSCSHFTAFLCKVKGWWGRVLPTKILWSFFTNMHCKKILSLAKGMIKNTCIWLGFRCLSKPLKYPRHVNPTVKYGNVKFEHVITDAVVLTEFAGEKVDVWQGCMPLDSLIPLQKMLLRM